VLVITATHQHRMETPLPAISSYSAVRVVTDANGRLALEMRQSAAAS
jgi:mannitol-1-/sugar-/sorbitol-6-phosphatase